MGPRTYLLVSSVVAAGAAFAAEAAGVPDGPDREAVVREMLERSRLLEDAKFRVARSVYEQYVREALQPARALPAPVPMVAEEGRYVLRIPADRKLALEASLLFRVLDPERCAKVRVLPAGWVWEEVKVNGAVVKLATEEAAGGWLWFSPTAPGEYRIEARSPQPKVPAAGVYFDLPVAATVQTLVGVESPDAWELVIVGSPLRLTGTAGAGTHGQVAARWGKRLSIRLQRPVAVTERPPRYAVRGDVAWNLDERLQQVVAELDVGIVGGPTERLDLSLPATAERVSVSGPDVREAQVAGGKATIFLRGKVRERTRLRVSYEMPLAKEGVQRLDPPSLADGHWAGGTLVVSNAAGGVEVLPGTLDGLRQVAIGDAADSARALAVGTPAVACEIAGRTWTAEVELLNLAEFALKESIADLAHYELMFRDDGMMLCKASYEIRNRARQFLRLDLPRGATVLQARVNEEPKPLTPVPNAPDAYLLPLVRSVASVQGLVTFPVDVVFLCRLDLVGGASAPREGAGADSGRGAETPRPQGLRGAETPHPQGERGTGTPRLQRRGEVALPLPRIDLPIAYAWCEASVPEGMRVRKWTGPLAKVDRYSNETATASLDYGLGMAAEGYKPKERPIPSVELVVDESRPEAEGEKKPPPRPAKSPERPTSRSGLLGILRHREKTTPATADIPLSPEPQPQPNELEDTVGDITAEAADKPQSSLSNKLLLGRNYWRAGKELYERGDYANAAKSLEQAIALNPKSQDAFNASKLLGNIRLVQPGQAGGQPQFKSQTEKAAAIQVTKQIKAGLKSLEQQQQDFVEKGLRAAQEGKGKDAQTQFQAAEAFGEQLIAQGANKEEVESRLRGAKGTIDALRKEEEAEAIGLYRRVQDLKEAGRYEEALRGAQQLLQYDVGGKSRIQHEIDALALDVAKEQTTGQLKKLERMKSELGRIEDRTVLLTDGRPQPQPPPKPPVQPPAARPDERGEWAAWDRVNGPAAVPETPLRRTQDEYGTLMKRLDDLAKRQSRVAHGDEGRLMDFDTSLLQWPRPFYGQPPKERDVRAAIAYLERREAQLRPDIPPKREPVGERRPDSGAAWGRAPAREATAGGHEGGRPREGVDLSRPGRGDAGGALRMHDVTDLTVDIRHFQGRRSALASDAGYASTGGALAAQQGQLAQDFFGAEENGDKKDEKLTGESLVDFIKKSIAPGTWGDGTTLDDGKTPYTITYRNGRIVTVHTPEVQKQVNDLLENVRKARGPQVQLGQQITLQKASGKLKPGDQFGWSLSEPRNSGAVDVDFGYNAMTFQTHSKGPALDPRFRDFVARNYDWSFETRGFVDAADRGQDPDDISNFGETLRFNLEQKVQVNGINLNVAPGEANGIGVTFNTGNNDLSYAVVDEAQLRTLLELDAAKKRERVAANPNAQETIVGTDAWLPNEMRANVRFAGETGNKLDIAGNPIELPHQKYILINNGSFLTAVQANPMQHWTEAMNPLPFAVTAPEIEVPHVGRLVKFEKTLVEPGDELVLKASYRYSEK